jgi:hypothetical protein
VKVKKKVRANEKHFIYFLVKAILLHYIFMINVEIVFIDFALFRTKKNSVSHFNNSTVMVIQFENTT